jgi:cytochrome c5
MVKMKFGKLLLIGATALLSFGSTAQGDDAKRECDRMRFLVGEEGLKKENYKAAVLYLHKAEEICGGLDKDNWDRLVGSLTNVINAETDEAMKKAYADSLAAAYDRQEAAGFYLETSDCYRASNILQSSNPDSKKADMYFQRCIKAQGTATHESFIVYSYYTTYLVYNSAAGDEKAALKKRMIQDYFNLSEIVAKAGMTPLTQETLKTYLDYVVESCEALLPEIPGYISNLPEDKEVAIEAIQRMITLLDSKKCDESQEYKDLVDAWVERAPEDLDALVKKASLMDGTKAIPVLRDIISKTDDPAVKANCQYQIAYAQYKAGQYSASHGSGKACTGEYRSKGLMIAAQSVAATAMSSGNSTFERKCNYIYAAQLAEQAGNGAKAATYRSKAPSSSDCFSENSPKSVTLTSWGVTVNPCP